jgi:sugar lactone lactonase YvrE
MGVAVVAAVAVSAAMAVPPGYVQQSTSMGAAVASFTYGGDGTLYAISPGSEVTCIAADGGRSSIAVAGVEFNFVSGMCVSGKTLYVANAATYGDGALYSVNLTTGVAAKMLAAPAIDKVAVSPIGGVFYSDTSGTDFYSGAQHGSVDQAVYDAASGTWHAQPLVSDLAFPSGLAFNPAGDLYFLQSDMSFSGEVYKLTAAQVSAGVATTPELVAGNLSAGFGLAMDSEGDLFATGTGGLLQLDRTAEGGFAGTASVFDAHYFSTAIAFTPGANAFEPGAGYAGGKLSYFGEYGDVDLLTITTVPEPATVALLLAGFGLLKRRK